MSRTGAVNLSIAPSDFEPSRKADLWECRFLETIGSFKAIKCHRDPVGDKSIWCITQKNLQLRQQFALSRCLPLRCYQQRIEIVFTHIPFYDDFAACRMRARHPSGWLCCQFSERNNLTVKNFGSVLQKAELCLNWMIFRQISSQKVDKRTKWAAIDTKRKICSIGRDSCA